METRKKIKILQVVLIPDLEEMFIEWMNDLQFHIHCTCLQIFKAGWLQVTRRTDLDSLYSPRPCQCLLPKGNNT